MKTAFLTIKISEEAQRLLKIVTALSGEKFYYKVLERVLQEELARLAPGLEQRRAAEKNHAIRVDEVRVMAQREEDEKWVTP